MAVKGKYLVELKDNAGADDIARAQAALNSNAAITAAAHTRKRFGGDERWWSVGAGVIIILLFVMSSFDWDLAANITAIALFVYMAFVMAFIVFKRLKMKRAPLEIDPREALAALFSKALGIKCDPRVAEMLASCDFDKTLKPLCERLAEEAGITNARWSVAVEVNLRMLESAARNVIKMPCAVNIAGSDSTNSVEITCEYMATFVSAGGDDYMTADLSPEIIGSISLSPLTRITSLMTVGWENGLSDRWRAMNK